MLKVENYEMILKMCSSQKKIWKSKNLWKWVETRKIANNLISKINTVWLNYEEKKKKKLGKHFIKKTYFCMPFNVSQISNFVIFFTIMF